MPTAPAQAHHRAGAFPWRDYDADTGRFTALDRPGPHGAKGAGALPIAVAGGATAGPMIATTVARNPEKVEQAYDFLTGALVPGPPTNTPAGMLGGSIRAGFDYLTEEVRDE